MINRDEWITIAESKVHHGFSFLVLMAIATVDYSHLCDRTDCLNPYHGPLDLGINVGELRSALESIRKTAICEFAGTLLASSLIEHGGLNPMLPGRKRSPREVTPRMQPMKNLRAIVYSRPCERHRGWGLTSKDRHEFLRHIEDARHLELPVDVRRYIYTIPTTLECPERSLRV